MELRQIKHVIAVAETGSFTKASERASISQPALSASIAKLEAEFEVRLFDRRRSRVVPTPAGFRFLEKAGSVLTDCSSLKAEVRKVALPQPLRIGVLRTLPTRLIADLVKAYRRAKPGASISLFDGTRADLQKRFQERKLIALITSTDSSTIEPQSRLLFKDKFVLIAPTDHRFAREESIKLADLNGEPFITRTSCEAFQETCKVFAERGIKPRIAFMTDQDDRALDLVAAGVGLAMVPEAYSRPGVVQIRLADYDVFRSICLQWSPTQEHEHLKDFVKIASTHDWKSRS